MGQMRRCPSCHPTNTIKAPQDKCQIHQEEKDFAFCVRALGTLSQLGLNPYITLTASDFY